MLTKIKKSTTLSNILKLIMLYEEKYRYFEFFVKNMLKCLIKSDKIDLSMKLIIKGFNLVWQAIKILYVFSELICLKEFSYGN